MKNRVLALLPLVLVLALALFTGSALAGNGNGNGNSANAPGHQSSAPAPAPATAPAPLAAKDRTPKTAHGNPHATSSSAPSTHVSPGQAKHSTSSSSSATTHTSPGQAKHQSVSPSAPTTNDNSHGVKPFNNTAHNTWAPASSNKTKQYGNGQTAGQIAQKAGYNGNLYGPGNSQPHKANCGGHLIDVHALKNHPNKCGTSTSTPSESAPAQAQATQTQTQSNCAGTTQTVTQNVLTGVAHKTGHGYVVIHPNAHSAHLTGKHPDDVPLYQIVASTITSPATASCAVTSTQSTSSTASTSSTSSSTASVTSAHTSGVSAATTSPAHTTAVSAGGVKGAVVTLKPTKTASAGGVLGTVTHLGHTVASGTLPFTGLPLWIFALVAAALVAIGVLVRRSTAHDRI
jgi:hypothetical protein